MTRKNLATVGHCVAYVFGWGIVCSLTLNFMRIAVVANTPADEAGGLSSLYVIVWLALMVLWVSLVVRSTRRYHRTYGMTKEEKKALA